MSEKPLIISSKSSLFQFRDLKAYKELFWMLAWRDFKVRYAQTTVGILWAFIQPILTIAILHVVFGKFVKVDTGNTPHMVFTACGMMAWTYFSFVMTNAGSSIISAQSMVKKIYFPRIIIPLSKALVGLIDMAITATILAGLMIYNQVSVSSNIVYLPLFLALLMITSLSIGILFSALSIRFRDIQYLIPFVVQLGLYITPTAYPSSVALNSLPQWATIIYYLNPMAGIVEGFRWSILGLAPPSIYSLISFAMIAILFAFSLYFFKKIDSKIADLV